MRLLQEFSLIAEITGGYVLFIPLMIVSAMAYFITRYFEPNSIYTKTLIESGFIARDKDTDLLNQLSLTSVITEKRLLNASP
jgi:CIC family chloride channel protein